MNVGLDNWIIFLTLKYFRGQIDRVKEENYGQRLVNDWGIRVVWS
jgi:hypothetical protein